jgi:NADH-quinone oxidoreductase subunit N
MNMFISDILLNAPFAIVVLTTLAVLVVESTRGTRPNLSSWTSIGGLSLAACAALSNLGASAETFGGMLQSGGIANFYDTLFCVAAVMTIIFSRNYFERQNYHRGEAYILILFASLGMMVIAAANDLIMIFLGIELMSICLYVLAGLFRHRDRSNEASLKYFLLGAFATGFLLYGIALIYGSAGSTNITSIRAVFPRISHDLLFLTGSGLLLAGFAFKIAAVPFHMWAPDVYEGSPTPVSGFMSTGAKAAAFAALITVFSRVFGPSENALHQIIALIAAASMIAGNIVALAQSNLKRLLAYSSIAHAGYMLVGLAAGTADGQIGVMYYLAVYVLMNLGAFGLIGALETENDQNLQLEDYAGLSERQPLLAACMSVFLFGLAGVPPFAGFFGKYYVFLAAVKAHLVWLAIIGVLASLISAYYYLRIIVIMYFEKSKAEPAPVSVPMSVRWAVIFCAFLVLLFGLFPSVIVQTALRVLIF